ncbi:hypothetical protein [Bradyrhizobium lablabi]|uniref:hypothetical protein n=1 Tax=Bradyrhizobium lablabi TaxID=722472 RepID=UPI001BAA3F85|nr:hypothetical protein [Bradyrhizobium lablabi]MBR0692821.1 hypothetical protein [Bradyrhizobium lablabi]
MMRSIAIAWTILLPGMAFSAPADVSQPTTAIVAATRGAAVARPPATETLRGVIDSVDQGNDTIKIRLSRGATEQFKVQDGLIFNSVRFGDAVEVSVQSIAGLRTIVGLSRE